MMIMLMLMTMTIIRTNVRRQALAKKMRALVIRPTRSVMCVIPILFTADGIFLSAELYAMIVDHDWLARARIRDVSSAGRWM